jgi:hypothetical protein
MIDSRSRITWRAGRTALITLLTLLVWLTVAVVGSPDTAAAVPVNDALEHRVFVPVSLTGSEIASVPIRTAVPPSPTSADAPTSTPTATPTATVEPSPSATHTPSPTPTPEGYQEPLTEFPDLTDLESDYDPSSWYETMLEILARRYTAGHFIVVGVEGSEAEAKRWAGSKTASFDDLVGILPHVVHEMNHQLGMQEGVMKTQFQKYVFPVRDEELVEVTRHETFNRSEIARYVTGPLENQYKSIYLTGSMGRQGFFTLLDEYNAYTHSMFTGYGLHDMAPQGRRVSHRDGLVTFIMYTQFYLRHARERHPDDYELLRSDAELRDLVGLLWKRANFILDVTRDIPGLALDVEAIEAEVNKPEMRAEMEMFIAP